MKVFLIRKLCNAEYKFLVPTLRNFFSTLIFSICRLSICGLSCAAFSAEDFFADISTTKPTSENKESSFQHLAFVQQKIKYGLNTPDSTLPFSRDSEGISQIRTDIYAEAENSFSEIISLKIAGKIELDLYEWENGNGHFRSHAHTLLKDAYFDFTFSNGHWLRTGHQLFSWGESESLSVIDILSPRDLREFGQTELQDIREQVPALLYSFPFLDGKLNLVSTYDAGHNRYASENEEFYPNIIFSELPFSITQEDPDKPFEVALKYDKQFNGGDFSFLLAEVNDNEFAFSLPNEEATTITQTQERVNIIGLSVNKVWGSWLFKSEFARYFNQAVNTDAGFFISDQDRGVVGVEYSGINQWFFSYELSAADNKHTHPLINEDSSEPGHSLHIRYTSSDERFQQDLWYFDLLDNQGKITRWDINYEWSDSLTTGMTVVIYEAGAQESLLHPFAQHDSLNMSFKYYF